MEGASVDLLEQPKFEGRNGVIADECGVRGFQVARLHSVTGAQGPSLRRRSRCGARQRNAALTHQ
jgi:hypothetical protein